MPRERREFSPQFKAEAVQMVIETGRSVAEVARDLGVNYGTLRSWVTAWRDDLPDAKRAMSPTEQARVTEMQAEIRRLRLENEFLKKAAAFFARTPE
jgi:transposase-like protein